MRRTRLLKQYQDHPCTSLFSLSSDTDYITSGNHTRPIMASSLYVLYIGILSHELLVRSSCHAMHQSINE